MSDLLEHVIEAHGGIARWRACSSISARIVTGGGLWPLKGIVQDSNPRRMHASLHEQRASVQPFGQPDWRTSFSPNRIAIIAQDGSVVRERLSPRESFTGHVMNTPWDALDRAYFNGYAMWTYLTTPFCFAMPGFEAREVEPWIEGGETWRVLRVTFPSGVHSHCTEQSFYFGDDFMLRRHDYNVDVAGAIPVAQYLNTVVDFEGIRMPSQRRAFLRGPDGKPVREMLFVSIDLGEFALS